MKGDVVAANLANLRQSINELKECIEKQNATAVSYTHLTLPTILLV